MLALHGAARDAEPARSPQWTSPALRPTRARRRSRAPEPGRAELELDGVVFRKGGKVVLRPGTDRDVLDRMLDGRTATIERIYLDYEDGAHIAVTVDDDPGQELFRETGRYLFFRAGELEAVLMTRPRASRSWSPGSATPGCATTASAATSPSCSTSASCPPASACSTSAPAGSTSPTR